MPKIFDFDLTITATHTFRRYQLYSLEQMEDSIDAYNSGKEFAKTSLKKGINNYIKHGSQNFSAIATFHNNPNFVAGCIAVLLGKELTFKEKIISEDEDRPDLAVNVYLVDGEEIPFYISYIPFIAAEFNRAKQFLNNKNHQIHLIHDLWLNGNLIDEGSIIDFYDDTKDNYTKALSDLDFIKCHLVAPKNTEFTITSTAKNLKAKPEAASSSSSDVSANTSASIVFPQEMFGEHDAEVSMSAGESMEFMENALKQIDKIEVSNYQTPGFFKLTPPQSEDKEQSTLTARLRLSSS